MISPTGHNIRVSDSWGSGEYGASRDGGKRIHKGTDFIVSPGQAILAPCGGQVVRIKRPYSDAVDGVLFSGIFVRSINYEYTLFYFTPLSDIIGKKIFEGDLIGYAQDISIKYPGIIPHVHLQFDSINPELFLGLP